ncbi:MAG: RDD family protein, partial [Candidatus Saccharimonas sp.]|nr:RDD family protein [Planctomycetaceae bacterium]
ALVMSAPPCLIAVQLGTIAYRLRQWPLPPIPGVGGTGQWGGLLSNAAFWRDQFITGIVAQPPRTDGAYDWKVSAINAESGVITDLGVTLSGHSGFQPMNFADRLWFIGNTESFELVDGVLRPASFAYAPAWPTDDQRFLLNGEAAHVSRSPTGFSVTTFHDGKWGNDSELAVPATLGDWTFHYQRGAWITALSHGDRVHVFLHTEGRLFHREGLELQEADAATADAAVSALRPANFDGQTRGWSLVREKPNAPPPKAYSHRNMFGLLYEGQPAALYIEDNRDGYPVGYFYRLDGSTWTEFATQTFPFGSTEFRVVSRHDGRSSYILAMTTTGTTHVYAVDATGIRATNGGSSLPNPALNEFPVYAIVPAFILVLGILIGLGTWCLMWWYTKPDYGFGVQTVKLASLGRRGLARLIDLALIVFSTAGLGWAMTIGFDWLSLVEALNLHVDHPTIPIATRVASILALWLAFIVFSLLVVQARWGLTPGKWLCGLRTLRTTLKPCGFARSLVREVVLAVDACHFLCWTPGILSIAFTDCRQRLGDLVTDTLVVEVRSLSRRMPA